MIARFRKFEAEALQSGARTARQLVVAVTANGSECEECGANGFDQICPKPLDVREIYQLICNYLDMQPLDAGEDI